jgi:hypothetical protein
MSFNVKVLVDNRLESQSPSYVVCAVDAGNPDQLEKVLAADKRYPCRYSCFRVYGDSLFRKDKRATRDGRYLYERIESFSFIAFNTSPKFDSTEASIDNVSFRSQIWNSEDAFIQWKSKMGFVSRGNTDLGDLCTYDKCRFYLKGCKYDDSITSISKLQDFLDYCHCAQEYGILLDENFYSNNRLYLTRKDYHKVKPMERGEWLVYVHEPGLFNHVIGDYANPDFKFNVVPDETISKYFNVIDI